MRKLRNTLGILDEHHSPLCNSAQGLAMRNRLFSMLDDWQVVKVADLVRDYSSPFVLPCLPISNHHDTH